MMNNVTSRKLTVKEAAELAGSYDALEQIVNGQPMGLAGGVFLYVKREAGVLYCEIIGTAQNVAMVYDRIPAAKKGTEDPATMEQAAAQG